MQSLSLTRYLTPISPPRFDLYPLRQIAASVLSTPTAGINRREMMSRRESASFKSLAVARTSTGDDDDGYCTLIDFAGNKLLCLSELSTVSIIQVTVSFTVDLFPKIRNFSGNKLTLASKMCSIE